MKFKWVAVQLLIFCVIIFILQTLYPEITDQFALVSVQVLSKPWMFITSIFLHGSMSHLFYNMFALALFGLILEKIIGSEKFLILFFASGIVSGFGSVMFYPASIGASGAIFGILGTLAVLRPRMTVYVGYAPMPMIFAAGVWAFLDLIGMFAPSGVANAAHLFGLGFGIIVGLLLRKKFGEKLFRRKTEEMTEKEFREWENNWMR